MQERRGVQGLLATALGATLLGGYLLGSLLGWLLFLCGCLGGVCAGLLIATALRGGRDRRKANAEQERCRNGREHLQFLGTHKFLPLWLESTTGYCSRP